MYFLHIRGQIRLPAHCLNFYGRRKSLQMFDFLQSIMREQLLSLLFHWFDGVGVVYMMHGMGKHTQENHLGVINIRAS